MRQILGAVPVPADFTRWRLFDALSGISIGVMFDALSRDERLLLLRFVCAFAWTDLEVTPREPTPT